MSGKNLTETPLLNRNQFSDREHIVDLVRRWGDVNSDGVLDPLSQIFSDPHIEGLIGYRIESGNAVVFGDPVCASENKGELAKAFQKHCQNQNIGVIYTIASEEFANWAVKNLFCISIEFGEKFVLDPFSNPIEKTGSKAVLVRKKVKRALQEGILIKEYSGIDVLLERAIEDVADSWLKLRQRPQVYLAHANLFKDRTGKRWFYAMQGERVVGILLLNQLQSDQGWLLNNIMMTKDAPHGLSELLVIATLQVLEKENCRFVKVGPVAAKQLGKINGLGSLSTIIVRWIYKCAKKIFRLDGQNLFWQKFQPRVHPSYLLFPHNNLSFSSIKSLFRAFNVRI